MDRKPEIEKRAEREARQLTRRFGIQRVHVVIVTGCGEGRVCRLIRFKLREDISLSHLHKLCTDIAVFLFDGTVSGRVQTWLEDGLNVEITTMTWYDRDEG